jgi:antitoxin VapB
MAASTIFNNNRTQAVRLPSEMRFPDTIRKVDVRVVGQERIIAPAEATWDSFFLSDKTVSDDFMLERATQQQAERESVIGLLDAQIPARYQYRHLCDQTATIA